MFLDKALFTSFQYRPHIREGAESAPQEGEAGPSSEHEIASFQLSFAALLESLQMFGSEASIPRQKDDRREMYARQTHKVPTTVLDRVFDGGNLGMHGSCRLMYTRQGSSLELVLQEAGLVTKCQFATFDSSQVDEIPLQRNDLLLKVIMRASWLHDAMSELSSTGPQKLIVSTSLQKPYLKLYSQGAYGSASVEFTQDPRFLETWQITEDSTHIYQFSSAKAAMKAMSIASKVSIRIDVHGVMSLQFMVEVEGGMLCFVDYRALPQIQQEDEQLDI